MQIPPLPPYPLVIAVTIAVASAETAADLVSAQVLRPLRYVFAVQKKHVPKPKRW